MRSIEGWCEPPSPLGLHLSTLLHQILALIMQAGAMKPAAVWRLLCERGPFRTVSKSVFADLLRGMAIPEVALIEQSSDGRLMIGKLGEKIAESWEFYAVFVAPEEYRVIHGERTLGTYAVDNMFAPSQTIIFAGRRWRVLEIDDRAKVILVRKTDVALEPNFSGDVGLIHDKIVATMREVLRADDVPAWLDRTAARMLADARDAFGELGLHSRSIIPFGSGTLLFPWVGTKKLQTLGFSLIARNFVASPFQHAVDVKSENPESLSAILTEMANSPAPDPATIVSKIAKPRIEKFDTYLPEDLMNLVTVVERLNVESIPSIARPLIARPAENT